MAARLTGIPDWQFFTATGAVLASGKLYFYSPGTTDAKAIYDDIDKQTTLTNPVTLNSAGRVPSPVFAEGIYDIVIKDSDDNTIDTMSNWGDDWSAVGTDLSENLLSNASAETAGSTDTFENWTDTDSGSVITRDTTDPYHGTACFLFTSSQNGADYTTSDKFEVSPGKDLAIDFYVKASNASAEPKILVNWFTAAQASISTSTVYDDNVGVTPTSWTLKQGFRATPPATARYAEIELVGNDNSTQYTTRFDGVHVSQISAFSSEAPFQPFGLEISIDSGDTDHDVNVSAGAVKSDDFSDDLILSTEITKRIDASWAEGDDAGGLESGGSLPTDDLLYVWIIKNSSTGYVDVLISVSATSPTMPSGYDVKRYLGAVPVDSSSNIIGDTVWKGELCIPGALIAYDVDSTSLSDNTFVEYTITAPPESYVHFHCILQESLSDYMSKCYIDFRHASSSGGAFVSVGFETNGGDTDNVKCAAYMLVDSSSKLDITPVYSSTTNNPSLKVSVAGWEDLRRLNP